MIENVKEFFEDIVLQKDEIENEHTDDPYLIYKPVPLTLALCKRRYEEEQLEKYGITKEKMCEII